MRINETDRVIAARNREIGARAQLAGGCIFAVGVVLMAMAGMSVWPLPLTGLIIGCVGRMTVDSNTIGR